MTLVSIKKDWLVVHVEDDFRRLFGGIILLDLEDVGGRLLLDFLPSPKPNVQLILRVRTTGNEEIVVGQEVD